MKLIILGSGTNRINLKRSSPAYLLEVGEKKILIDTGNGCIKQLLFIKKNILDVDTILYSHFHKDHYMELPDILNQLFAQKRYPRIGAYPNKKPKKLRIYGPTGVRRIVSTWKKDCPVEINTILRSKFSLFGLSIESMPLLHKGPIIGFRFKEHNRVLVYTSDSKYCKNSVKLASGADVLVHSIGLPEKYKVTDIHPTPFEAGRVANEAGVKKLVLTHFYPAVEGCDFRKDIRKYYQGSIVPARDFMKINI